MKRIVTKAKHLLLSASFAILAIGLAVPPQALNAGCYLNSTPACPSAPSVYLTPPAPKPSGNYACFGQGSYWLVVNHTSTGLGYSQFSPNEQTCQQKCYRTVNGTQYEVDRETSVEGSKIIAGSYGCAGSPPA
jgi:hypothetical protein